MKISCPTCGKHLEIEDTGRYQCPSCNTVFDVEKEDTAQVPSQVPGLATCPYCKGAVNPDARKCTHCGEWIKEKPKNKAVYFILTLLFGQFGVGEMYMGNKLFYCIPTWIIPAVVFCLAFIDKDFIFVMPFVAWSLSLFFCICFLSSSNR